MTEEVADKLTDAQVKSFNEHFNFQTPFAFLKEIYQTNDTEKNNNASTRKND